jgi:hypothetical protein
LKDTRILHKLSFIVKLYLQLLWHYGFKIFKEQCSVYAGSRRGVPREVLKSSLTVDDVSAGKKNLDFGIDLPETIEGLSARYPMQIMHGKAGGYLLV